jgi:hypothetical protein
MMMFACRHLFEWERHLYVCCATEQGLNPKLIAAAAVGAGMGFCRRHVCVCV